LRRKIESYLDGDRYYHVAPLLAMTGEKGGWIPTSIGIVVRVVGRG
jgi:hypothetical protein